MLYPLVEREAAESTRRTENILDSFWQTPKPDKWSYLFGRVPEAKINPSRTMSTADIYQPAIGHNDQPLLGASSR